MGLPVTGRTLGARCVRFLRRGSWVEVIVVIVDIGPAMMENKWCL